STGMPRITTEERVAMVRLIPQPGEPLDPSALHDVNELMQARIDGRISRRALIQRAMHLGVAAPVIGVMLHLTSDYAFGASSNGRALTLRRLQEKQPVPVTGPTQPQGEPQEGGTIVTGTPEEPDTLHPWLSQLVTGSDVYCGIVETLFKYDSTQTLQPALAESVEISPDGLTYTFKLRPNVTFHNGDPFSGRDIVECWKMIMNPDFGAFSQLGWNKITDITLADNDLTVTMKTSEAYAPFISYICDNGSNICPASAMAKGIDNFKQEFGRAPIGTGPMKFVEWRAKEQITLERNEQYWGEKPRLERVIYRIVPDDNTQLVQLRTGEIQYCASSGALGALRVDEALGIEGVTVYEHLTMAWSHLDLKHIDFLRITKVRQALDYATPKEQIINQLLKGRVVPSVVDQAPGTWAFNPNIQPRPFDPEMAKQLLREAGLSEEDGGWSGPTPAPSKEIDPNIDRNGPVKKFEMELWGISGDSQSQQIIQVIAAAWNSIGIKTEAKFEDVSTIWGPEGYQFTDKMTACLYSWFNANDPDDMFYWHSSQIPSTPTGSGGNLPAYFFPYNFQAQIDDLTSRAAKETDQEKRKELYWQIQELLHEEVPVIFIYWGKAFPVVANNVGGVWPSAFNRLLWNVNQWYLTK
ncbi:MAG: hypothetical protein C4345_07980, partial [Chloroflexota bacterium]